MMVSRKGKVKCYQRKGGGKVPHAKLVDRFSPHAQGPVPFHWTSSVVLSKTLKKSIFKTVLQERLVRIV